MPDELRAGKPEARRLEEQEVANSNGDRAIDREALRYVANADALLPTHFTAIGYETEYRP
jgi:outer membrane biosynthesis protein TonB